MTSPSGYNVTAHFAPTVWRTAADALVQSGQHVTLNVKAIPDLLPMLTTSTDHSYWRDYVGPVDPDKPDLGRLFYELALTISQFGGFISYLPDGRIENWKVQGSGVKAVLATMAELRAARVVPGIDIFAHYKRRLAPHFIDKPFARERLRMLIEVATHASPEFFRAMMPLTRTSEGAFHFNAAHMLGLACRMPMAFGQDGEFYKKGSLLLMTMELALKQLGYAAHANTIPPADYRIPQILEGFGILKFSDDLADKLANQHVFSLTDPEVRALRAATVQAVAAIGAAYEQRAGTRPSPASLDGMLYMLSRNATLMNSGRMKPHMTVATMAF